MVIKIASHSYSHTTNRPANSSSCSCSQYLPIQSSILKCHAKSNTTWRVNFMFFFSILGKKTQTVKWSLSPLFCMCSFRCTSGTSFSMPYSRTSQIRGSRQSADERGSQSSLNWSYWFERSIIGQHLHVQHLSLHLRERPFVVRVW